MMRTSAIAQRASFTATGIVVPANWDDDGNPVGVVLATFAEEEYVVTLANRRGQQLSRLLQRRVRVTGTVEPAPRAGRPVLRVERFELLGEGDWGDLAEGPPHRPPSNRDVGV